MSIANGNIYPNDQIQHPGKDMLHMFEDNLEHFESSKSTGWPLTFSPSASARLSTVQTALQGRGRAVTCSTIDANKHGVELA